MNSEHLREVSRELRPDAGASEDFKRGWHFALTALDLRLRALEASAVSSPSPETLARRFHEAYERLAPEFGYKTREASAVPWEDVPEANKRLMIATCAAVSSPPTITDTVRLYLVYEPGDHLLVATSDKTAALRAMQEGDYMIEREIAVQLPTAALHPGGETNG